MLTIDYAKDLYWVNPEHTAFDCTVKFNEFSEEVPFGCRQDDSYQHAKDLFTRAIAGDFGEIAEYVPSPEPVATEPQPEVSGAQTL